MLVLEVLRAASLVALMLLPCLALMSRNMVFASNVRSSILLVYLVCSNSWVRFSTSVVNSPRRASMVWILPCRPISRFARLCVDALP